MGAPSSANQFRDSPKGGHERLDLLYILLVAHPKSACFLGSLGCVDSVSAQQFPQLPVTPYASTAST